VNEKRKYVLYTELKVIPLKVVIVVFIDLGQTSIEDIKDMVDWNLKAGFKFLKKARYRGEVALERGVNRGEPKLLPTCPFLKVRKLEVRRLNGNLTETTLSTHISDDSLVGVRKREGEYFNFNITQL
jgi:hypothetical protein